MVSHCCLRNLPSCLKPHRIFLYFLFAVLGFNIFQTSREILQLHRKRRQQPYIFTGKLFSGLDDILKGTKKMGYYTDKSMDNPVDAMQFAQAQYTLAPIVLEFNGLDREYILFDCTDKNIAYEKMKAIGAVGIRQNQFGIILARNPKAVKK